MATYTVDKVTYNGNTYNLQDAGALQTTGGTVTGPVTFDDTITTNDIQTTTINDVEVGDSPKFTDTVTTATTTGDGNAITSITASNGALNVQKSTTFIHAAGTGLSKSGSTLNHSNSITAGTIGTSSNTSGVTIAVPYATYDAQGHITNKGTHTHTVTTATASTNGVGRVAGGTNVSVTYSSGVATVNAPSNVSAFTNDAGYITEADIPEGAAAYTGTPSAVSTTAAKGTSNAFARGDHVHNITGTTITDALGYTPGTVTGVIAGTGLKVGTNTSGGTISTSGTINHINSVTAKTTQGLYPITYDAQGHITGSGDKVTSLPASDVSDWAKASTKPTYTASEVGAIPTSQKGANSGVAELDANGKVPSSQLPSYVDDVLEYSAKSSFPTTGEAGKIYVDTTTNLTYRWSGSAYVEISPSLALGTTSSTAFRGDYGNTAYNHATDSSRLTTVTSSGLYKVASTAQGHIASLTAVQKSDITALGIPGSDTNTTYTLTQDATDGHKITLTPSSGTATTITIPDNNTTDLGSMTGTLEITQGGTGGTTAAAARTNLGLGSAATYTAATSVGNNSNLPTGAAIQSYVTGLGYITSASVPSAATATPLMDGTGAIGTSGKWAKEDHVHPSDSSKVDTVSNSSYGQATVSNDEGVIDLYIEPQSGSTGSRTGITIGGEFTRVYHGDNNYFDATPSGFTTSYVSSSGKQFTSHVGSNSSDMTIYGESETDSWGSIDLWFDQNTDEAQARLRARGAISSGTYSENEIRVTPTTTTIKNVVTPVDNGDVVPKSYVDSQVATKQATLVSGTNIKTINGTSLLGSGNITTPDTDEKVAQNNSTAPNDFRVLLSNSVSDSSETAATNKSAGLRFMPSTNHLYVGSAGDDAYISVSPRVYVGAYNRYTQDGQTESSTSYGVGIGINNALAYNSCLTVSSLQLQHWNSSRPSGGVPSSTNYVNSFSSLTYEHILFRDYSGKDSLTAESELTSTQLSFISSGTTYTVTPTKINKWDNYTDTKNTTGSTNTSSKIFLVGATSQAANPQTYSHDTAYVGTNGHLYSNSKQVVNLSDSQTISNKTLDNSNIISSGTVVNNPAITSTTFDVAQSTWGATTSTYTKAIGDFVCRRWGPVVMLYIRFTTDATGGTGTTRIFFTPADNYKPVGLYYCQVNATTAPYAQVTNASFWFTPGGILQGRAVADTEYRISCMYLVNN